MEEARGNSSPVARVQAGGEPAGCVHVRARTYAAPDTQSSLTGRFLTAARTHRSGDARRAHAGLVRARLSVGRPRGRRWGRRRPCQGCGYHARPRRGRGDGGSTDRELLQRPDPRRLPACASCRVARGRRRVWAAGDSCRAHLRRRCPQVTGHVFVFRKSDEPYQVHGERAGRRHGLLHDAQCRRARTVRHAQGEVGLRRPVASDGCRPRRAGGVVEADQRLRQLLLPRYQQAVLAECRSGVR